MKRCPSCGYPLPHDRERVGARCPNCRDPLYEPPSRISRPAGDGEGACALHAGRETVGVCGRCGNYFCEVCRTRWRGQTLCAACVDRALAMRETTPEQARTHFRQAFLGLLMGFGAWGAFVLAMLFSVATVMANGDPFLALLVLFLFVVAVLLAVLGTGQAAAALRTRGNQMIMATGGLLVSGLFIGAFLGLLIFRLWTD